MKFAYFNNEQLAELHARNVPKAKSPITSQDLAEFLKNPGFWRPGPEIMEGEELQKWMQGVYDELGIKCQVPPVPELRPKQKKSLVRFGLRLFFIPHIDIDEDAYPDYFIKPDWNEKLDASNLMDALLEPLPGRWVAAEIITKPNWNDGVYPEDRLAAALKIKTRFGKSWDDLHPDLLKKAAQVAGFPVRSTRLATVKEWNFLANLFNFLRKTQGKKLPDFYSTNSLEWCENSVGSDGRLLIGNVRCGALASLSRKWHGCHSAGVGFRVLVVL